MHSTNTQTNQQFDTAISLCKGIFKRKTNDYGTAWRILRPSALTDQLLIKALRIRTIQEGKIQKVGDSVKDEFVGIVNYAAMALIQLSKGYADYADINKEEAVALYNEQLQTAKQLMLNKNHDYGEAWRQMRISSITDLIIQKLMRIKSIEDNDGKTEISEGLEANYLDMVNYAIFVLIKMQEQENSNN